MLYNPERAACLLTALKERLLVFKILDQQVMVLSQRPLKQIGNLSTEVGGWAWDQSHIPHNNHQAFHLGTILGSKTDQEQVTLPKEHPCCQPTAGLGPRSAEEQPGVRTEAGALRGRDAAPHTGEGHLPTKGGCSIQRGISLWTHPT